MTRSKLFSVNFAFGGGFEGGRHPSAEAVEVEIKS
jgi:hypothetical protein